MSKLLVLNEKQLNEQLTDERLVNIYNKINSNEKLSECDIKYMARSLDEYHAEYEEQDSRRWSQWVYIVINIQNRYFEFGFDEGLTEQQEDNFSDTHIAEVIPKERTVIQHIIDWENIK